MSPFNHSSDLSGELLLVLFPVDRLDKALAAVSLFEMHNEKGEVPISERAVEALKKEPGRFAAHYHLCRSSLAFYPGNESRQQTYRLKQSFQYQCRGDIRSPSLLQNPVCDFSFSPPVDITSSASLNKSGGGGVRGRGGGVL